MIWFCRYIDVMYESLYTPFIPSVCGKNPQLTLAGFETTTSRKGKIKSYYFCFSPDTKN